jgi:hypothetical protein
MSHQPDDAVEVLRAVWAADGQDRADLDEACGAQKPCKNMKHVSFDGLAEPGTDLQSAWRERLEREGKLNSSGGTIRDLVLGRQDSARP